MTRQHSPLTYSRREFLKRTGILLGGLGLVSSLGLNGCGGSRSQELYPPVGPPDTGWDLLSHELSGPVLRPGDPGFAELARPWNLRYAETLPLGIARCRNRKDVQLAIGWARDQGLPLVARSGGHSYAGYSTTRGLMIDVSLMNSASYDRATGIVTLGGGTRNSTIYDALRPVDAAVTHGRCRQVGVAGLVLGGGVGFDMRRRGLTCDSLVSTELVTADGRALQCDAQQHPELFWACRGAGGGNFGINTSFTFQTHPVGRVTVFSLTWTDQLEELFEACFGLLPTLEERFGVKLSATRKRDQGITINLLGQLSGTPDELAEMLEPLYTVRPPDQPDIRTLSYWDGQEFLGEEGLPEYSQERSRYVYGTLGADATALILERLRSWPGTRGAATWKFFLTGGRVDDRARTDTAYVHRGADLLTSIDLEWAGTDPAGLIDQNLEWLNEFHQAMGAYASQESYQNFIDPYLENPLEAYYAENLPRLIQVKSTWDPDNVFRYPQSVPVG